jgi:hypothetical protein
MDNPPKRMFLDPEKVEKMHAVVGVMLADQFIAIMPQRPA